MELFVLCDGVTYYCYDFIVYDKTRRVDLHTNVVLELAQGLPKNLSFNLILDRGFTSPLLLQKLRELGYGATGTCMPNRKFYPKAELVLNKNAKHGDYIARVANNPGMVAVVWQDKKPVHFLSTCVGLEARTVGRRQYTEEGTFQRAEVSCPEICVHYNTYKDAVDQFNKRCLRSGFSLEKIQVSRKWWHKLYWGLLDSVLVNSFVLWELCHGSSDKFTFMASLQESMLGFVHPRERVGIRRHRNRDVYVAQDRHLGRHFVERMPGDTRRVCVVCRAEETNKRKVTKRSTGESATYVKPARSRFWCALCQAALCVEPCFKMFHEETNIVGIDH
jgi:Transposase IS4